MNSENISLDTKVGTRGRLEDAPLQLSEEKMKGLIKEVREVSDMLYKLGIEIKMKGLKP